MFSFGSIALANPACATNAIFIPHFEAKFNYLSDFKSILTNALLTKFSVPLPPLRCKKLRKAPGMRNYGTGVFWSKAPFRVVGPLVEPCVGIGIKGPQDLWFL